MKHQKREKGEKEGREIEKQKQKCSPGAHVELILVKCPHLGLINTRVYSYVHPRAHCYKTKITSPGKLMERQIKN